MLLLLLSSFVLVVYHSSVFLTRVRLHIACLFSLSLLILEEVQHFELIEAEASLIWLTCIYWAFCHRQQGCRW